jgi:RNA ligase (TIGR02306 family)
MRKLATINKIEEIKPIEGADKIEVARIKGWWVVIEKGKYKVGDSVVYCEIDSFLPVKPEYLFLLRGSNPKKMVYEGKEIEGIRLKTIKLRGQISQGLILPIPEGLAWTEDDNDVTELLGIVKYEVSIPAQLSGTVKGNFPSFIPKTDEERIQNMKGVLTRYYVTEKLDGSSVTYYKKDGVLGVCSRNLELKECEGTQWRLAKEMDLFNKIPDNFALQGELVGEGIQGNPLKIKGQKVYFYNIYRIDYGKYLDYKDMSGILAGIGLDMVPVLNDNYSLPSEIDDLTDYAEGISLINTNVQREGIVVRPKVEMDYKGQRLSFKAISNKYLLEEK